MSNIPTPHINAKPGDFARTVLMPGDPLRAKFIAETFLTNVKLVNNVRGIQGSTGEYKGKKVFVLSPIWRDQREGKAMGTFEGCRAVIIENAKKLGLIHIDGLILVPPLKSLFADGFLHPNDNGFSLYAENLIKEVQKYI